MMTMEDKIIAVRKEINEQSTNGMTKDAAFTVVAKKYKLAPRTIENMYYAKGGYAKYANAARNAAPINRTNNTPQPQSTPLCSVTITLTRSELAKVIESVNYQEIVINKA